MENPREEIKHFKLPLFANIPKNATPRLDALKFLTKVGVPYDQSTIGMSYDKSSRQWIDGSMAFQGYSPLKLHFNLKGLTEYLGDDE